MGDQELRHKCLLGMLLIVVYHDPIGIPLLGGSAAVWLGCQGRGLQAHVSLFGAGCLLCPPYLLLHE